MAASRPTVLLVAVWLLSAGAAVSQEEAAPGGDRLLGLAGRTTLVRYTPGYLDRAEHVLRRLDLGVEYLQQAAKIRLSVSAVVLPREVWEESGVANPYGTPSVFGASILVVPAMGDRGTVRLWKQWLGSDLPELPGRPLRGTAEGASSLALADLLLQRDLAAMFVERAGLAGNEAWIRGIMTHLVALTLFGHYEASRLLEIETVYARLESNLPVLLEAAGDRDMQIERWLLTQAGYFRGALMVFDVREGKGLKSAIKSTKKGEPLNRPRVLKLYPELGEWVAAL